MISWSTSIFVIVLCFAIIFHCMYGICESFRKTCTGTYTGVPRPHFLRTMCERQTALRGTLPKVIHLSARYLWRTRRTASGRRVRARKERVRGTRAKEGPVALSTSQSHTRACSAVTRALDKRAMTISVLPQDARNSQNYAICFRMKVTYASHL